jgi:hypothetical protein
MVDDGNTLIEALIGVVIVGIARTDLVRFYALTGNPAGARLQAKWDSVRAAQEEGISDAGAAAANLNDPRAVREALIGTAFDRRMIRGLRMEMLYILGMAPCTNVRELVFGPDADIRDAFARARRELARSAADSAWLDLMYRTAERPPHVQAHGVRWKLIFGVADVAGALLRNRRIPACVRVFGALGGTAQ